MKNMYSNFKLNLKSNYLIVLLMVLLGNSFYVNAQVRVPFTQRTSIYTPQKTVYNVKGDFTMIGNSNLTLVDYADDGSNANNMRYIDIDGDSNTWNSSSANLTFSTENGANPECSSIVYAGLYWTGRASDASTSPNIFTVSRNVPGGTQTINQNSTVGHNQAIANTTYSLSISRDNPSNNNRSPIYTFSSGGNSYVFRFTNNTGANRVTLSVNGGTAVNVPVSYSTSGSTGTATLTTPYVIVNGTVNLTINSLVRSTATNLSTGDTQSTSFANVNVAGTIVGTITETKTFDKRKISIKGPSSAAYTQLTADDDDIYYPVSSDGFMYSGYIEVTDYVRNNGLGAYTIADVALIEGNGGGTGYYGGWGMVVVYENDNMKWRDVTIFDGHSYVAGSVTADFEIPVSGFNTVQAGPVNMKLGMMAGEGDRAISGDYFQIRNHPNTSWVTLNHGGNGTNNFFNSSIFTGGNTRNPNLLNNTGLDISMFDIPNANNSVITNNQTSTRFRYGTTQDTFVIFNITMSVDAYIPETEGIISIASLNNVPAAPVGPYSVQPGQEIEYDLEIKNLGTEAVNNYKIVIPIPFTASFVPGSLSSTILFSPNPTPNNLYFDPALGATGSIVWDFGTLPLPADPQTLLASLRFRLKATENCAILSNPECLNDIVLNGFTSGVGAITGTMFKDRGLILGYDNSNGACLGQPIPQPLAVNVNADNYVTQNCDDVPLIRNFTFCDVTGPIPASQLASAFPPGTKFYTTYPVTTPEITSFPISAGDTVTYYAVPFNGNGCYFQFTVSFCGEIIAQDDVLNAVSCATSGVVGNALLNDTVDGNQATPSIVTFQITSGNHPNISFDAQGNITVVAGIPAGQYIFEYSICETSNLTNCDSATITINIVDSTPPVFASLPGETTINCPATPAFEQASATDSCGTVTLTFEDVTTTGACAGSYSTTRTWTATDASGNISTATQTINVVDDSAPVIDALPAESTISCPATPQFTQATATDVCGSDFTLTYVDATTNGQCAGSYSVTRTWTATDACGNSSTASQTINVEDNTAPVINPLPGETTISCVPSPINRINLSFDQAVAIDECGSDFTLTFVDTTVEGDCEGSYSVTRTWTATDTCGNSSTATQTINVIDTTAPVIDALPSVTTISCPDVPQFTQATAIDECDSAFTLTFEDVTTNGSCAGSYSVTRTWTAIDECGNTSTASQTINVQDNTAPVLAGQGADVTISCTETATFTAPTATDTCDNAPIISFTDETVPGACAGTSVVTRTWIATDACGNQSAPVSQSITIQDNTAPVLAGQGADVTINCTETAVFTAPTATDTCDTAPVVSFTDETVPGACAGTSVVTRTWTAVDACGNQSAPVSQTITIEDNSAPILSGQGADSTINCPATPEFTAPTAADTCDTAPVVSFTDETVPGACAGTSVVTRTWIATDACGNQSAPVSQTITVQDITNPVITIEAASIVVECDGSGNEGAVEAWLASNGGATATDSCSDVTWTNDFNALSNDCSTAITVIFTATDACGNTATTSATFAVQDNTAPVAPEAPADVTVACASEVPATISLTATDNCAGEITVEGVDTTVAGDCPNSFVITRTWLFVDACGNETPISQTITVNDTIAPTFVEQLPTASLTVECDAIPAMITLTAIDNCGEATVTENVTTEPSDCPNNYVITRTWTATDECGNATSHTQTITVQDTTAPEITLQAASIVVECDGSGNQGALEAWLASNGGATATDSCSDVTWTNDFNALSNDCSTAITVIFTATDACGNTATTSATFAVQDNTAPVAPEAPAAVTVACASEVPATILLTATDNCAGEITVEGVDTTVAGDCPNSFVITRTWLFVDACGNETPISQTITVNDTIAPTFVEQLPTASLTVECDAIPAMITLTAIDNCGEATVTENVTTEPSDCPNNYVITRTWTATDECGNETSHVQTITVQDTTAPEITLQAASIVVECDGSGNEGAVEAWLASNGGATATDSCSDVTWTNDFNALSNDCSTAITVIFTATDACGNTATTSATFAVQDSTAPVAPEAPADVTVACASEVPATISLTATDNCAGEITVEGVDTTVAGDCPNSFVITRTWTFVDACGNETPISQTITVNDTIAPTFVEQLPTASLTVECDAIPAMITLTAIDNCGEATVIENVTTELGDCPNNYVITRTWTAVDACGNETSHVQTITVQDTTAPIFNEDIPAEITVSCDDIPQPEVLTATDNCGEVSVVYFQVISEGNCPNNYLITRAWTATDSCGNTSLKKQFVNVQDITPPTFVEELPGDLTVECSDLPAAVTLTAIDNCGDASITFTESTEQGQCAGAYVVTRTWTAIDACNNQTVHTQIVTVQDTTAPTFVEQLPAASLTVECDAIPAMDTLTAIDNCGEVTVTENVTTEPGDCPNNYVITRTWTAVDACGNETSHVQTITVQDTTNPVITTEAASIVVECDGSGNEGAVEAWLASNGGATATDSCSDVTWTNDFNALSNDCSTAITVIFTATDACGNTATTSATFAVQDNTAPVAPEAPAAVTVACASEVPATISLTATDNCAGEITVEGVDTTVAGDCPNSFVITRTWTFVDACNNDASISQTITVQDTIAPTFVEELPGNITVECDAIPAIATLTAIDNCGEATVVPSVSTQEGQCLGTYVITRTWIATDECGNATPHAQTITVQDTTAPEITLQAASIVVECDGAGNTDALQAWLASNGGATATDACSDITWTNDFNALSNDCSTAITVIFTATDACGNFATTAATFTVQDTVAPTFVEELPADLTVECDNIPVAATLTAIDNCGEATVLPSTSTQQGDCPNNYVITRTWIATDECGNATPHTQTITVQDTTAPVITTEAASIVVECDGSGNEGAVEAWLASNGGATATDSCSDVTWTNDFNALSNDCSTAITVIFTATDACGNTATTSATFAVQDNTAPVAPEAPAAVTVACASEVPATISLTATDNCAGEITVEGVDTVVAGDCPNSFVITRTWTFVDACNNDVAISQTITVNDNVNPEITTQAASIVVECDGLGNQSDVQAWLASNGGASATDNCSDITWTNDFNTLSNDCSTAITVIFTATDACGNFATTSATFTVQDTTDPVAPQVPADLVLTCDSEVPATISLTATDACSGEITVDGVDSVVAGDCPNSFVITRTWTFVDECGNETPISQTITVDDTVQPEITTEATNLVVECDGSGNQDVIQAWLASNGGASATDNCSDVTWSNDFSNLSSDCSTAITITFTATDACGNTETTTATLTVQDNTNPVAPEAPANLVLACDSEVPATISLTATDNCSGEITVEGIDSIEAGDCPNSFVITRTWTFVDECGNETPISQTITVNDTIAPTFVEELPATELTVECDAIPAMITLTAIDNCGTASVAEDVTTEPGDCPGSYMIIRTWTATDECGITAIHQQTITVIDTTGPVSSEFDVQISVNCDAIPEVPSLQFTDACSGVDEENILFNEEITNETSTSYTIVRTWDVMDNCGNNSEFTQTIIVNIQNSLTRIDAESCIGDITTVDLNNLLPAGTTGGVWVDVNNTGALNENIFSPSEVSSIGNYILQYQITEGDCPRVYEVTMNVNDDCLVFPCDAIVIHNAFSPNGDALNQYFSIENIENTECYTSNTVEIYNRWGVLVYEVQNYNNNDRRFEGISEGRATLNKNAELPTGTYFYIINYTTPDGNVVNKSGYLYLTR